MLKELIHPVNLPEEYYVEYEVEEQNGRLLTVAGGRDVAGNLYVKNRNEEILFIKSGNGYVPHVVRENGESDWESNSRFTEAFVSGVTQDFLELAKMSTTRYSPSAKHIGDEIVEGRECAMYRIAFKLPAYTQEYHFAIDTETGACVQWLESGKVVGREVPTNESFRCKAFTTMGVTLPHISHLVKDETHGAD